MIKRLWFLSILGVIAATLVACGESSSSLSLTPEDLNTTETDSLHLDADFAGKNFINDGIGEVTLRSTTDGDTAKFNVESMPIALRFLGVNTPESTGKIQPWGNAASAFTASKLTTAVRLVLINDRSLWGTFDSNGTRYLGFVWYMPPGGTEFRLLNLELVELAYTENLLFDQSDICDYFDAFSRGGAHAAATEARVFGQLDPSFDYSGQIYDVSIRFIRGSYGVSVNLRDREGNSVVDENLVPVMITLNNTMRVRIRAVVLGSIGNNLILRDVYDADPITDQFASIFMFTLYRDAPFQNPGDIVEIYCKATTFNDNVQLTDPELTTYDQKYPYRLITRPSNPDYQTVLTTGNMVGTFTPVDLIDLNVTASSTFAPYNGLYITANVSIRLVTIEEPDPGTGFTSGDYWRKDSSNNMTIYAYFAGTSVSFNLRIDGGMFPYVDYDWFEIGSSYTVSGYVAPYYENYQLQLLNGVSITLVEPV
jgi:endonuclease YncB( thermonuclease family)